MSTYRNTPEYHLESRFEMDIPLISQTTLINHANRCLECMTPFCNTVACPLHNKIPDICDSLCKNQWQKACDILHSTNNFPEITGRICPSPCETTCAQHAENGGVPVKQIEYQIAECGFVNDWIRPARIEIKSGKRIVVIGSGPAGLAAAQQLTRLGHEVIVFEKNEHIGGFLRYGIPEFRISQTVLNRRLEQLREEGIRFVTGITIGEDITHSYLCKMCDAICLAIDLEDVSEDSIVSKLGFRSNPDGSLLIDQTEITDKVKFFTTDDIKKKTQLPGQAIASGRRIAAQIDQYLAEHGDRK